MKMNLHILTDAARTSQHLRFAIITMLVSISSISHAQTAKPLPVLPTPDGAILRWSLPNSSFPSNGFKIYRTTNGDQTSIAVASPQPKDTAVSNKWIDAKFYDYLTELYKKPPLSDNDKFQRAILDLTALSDIGLAKTLGEFYEDKGLKTGVKYSYRVVAVNGTRETEVGKTDVTPGKSPAVSVPQRIQVNQRPNLTELTWEKPGGTDSLVVAYRIFRAEGDGTLELQQPDPFYATGNGNAQGERLNATPTYTDKTAQTNKIYRYAISSLDIFGRESAKSTPITVDMNKARPISIVNLKNLQSGNKTVKLEWRKIEDTHVSTVLILRGLAADKPLAIIAKVPASNTSFIDDTVKPATNYYYTLQLQTTDGSISSRGTIQTVRALNTTPPATPSNLKITPSKNSLEISWKANPESDLWGYMVLRAENDKTPVEDYVTLNTNPIKETRFTDAIPTGVNTKYVYRIVALNTSNVESKASEAVKSAIIDSTAPSAPVLVNASGLEGAIGLAWNEAGTPDLEKYEIFRVEPGGKPVLVATLKPNAIGYVDKTVLPNLNYTYVVTAVDTSGSRSEPSNTLVARAFLTKAPDAPKGLKANLTKDGVKLEWIKLDAPIFYIVYRLLPNGKTIQVSSPLETSSFVDKGGKAGMRYVIKAIDLSGNLSAVSEVVVVR